ncbi:hypothetical protein ACJX0J_036492, partial [Zea mays]
LTASSSTVRTNPEAARMHKICAVATKNSPITSLFCFIITATAAIYIIYRQNTYIYMFSFTRLYAKAERGIGAEHDTPTEGGQNKDIATCCIIQIKKMHILLVQFGLILYLDFIPFQLYLVLDRYGSNQIWFW